MKAFNQISQSAGYKEDDIAVSLTVCGGSYGGGLKYCWSLDEVMGNTYIWNEQANTLKARDYKQPQAVIYDISANNRNT